MRPAFIVRPNSQSSVHVAAGKGGVAGHPCQQTFRHFQPQFALLVAFWSSIPLTMTNFDDFKAGNAAFVEAFAKTDDGAKPMPPARHALLITCMDARLHPEKVTSDVGRLILWTCCWPACCGRP